jgi:hypothetical protein
MRVNLLLGGISLVALVLAGCAVMQSGAPEITPAMIRAAGERGQPPETLASGRRLLAMRCTSCHALEPVAKYSVSEWKMNVQKMSGRAGLDASEALQITSYLVAARESVE